MRMSDCIFLFNEMLVLPIIFVGVLGAFAVLVLTGLAVLAELDENDDPSDDGDQHEEIKSSGFADIVESAPSHSESGNENNEGVNSRKNGSHIAAGSEYQSPQSIQACLDDHVKDCKIPVLLSARSAAEIFKFAEADLYRICVG